MDWFLYDNGLRHERVKRQKLIIGLINGKIVLILIVENTPKKLSSVEKK